jgi:hypothetical protein
MFSCDRRYTFSLFKCLTVYKTRCANCQFHCAIFKNYLQLKHEPQIQVTKLAFVTGFALGCSSDEGHVDSPRALGHVTC